MTFCLQAHYSHQSAATYAGCNGLLTEWIEQCGRWREKKTGGNLYDINNPHPEANNPPMLLQSLVVILQKDGIFTVKGIVITMIACSIQTAWISARGIDNINPFEKIRLIIQQLGD